MQCSAPPLRRGALLIRGPRLPTDKMGPGSAVQREGRCAASGTRRFFCAIQFSNSGALCSPLPRRALARCGEGRRRTSAISRRHAPEGLQEFLRAFDHEGAGNAGCSMAPAASRAIVKQSTQAYSPQVHRIHTGIPCAMVLRLLRDLPGVPGFLATIARGITPANLTPASGCQDHTAWPSASGFLRPGSRPRPSHPAPRQRRSRAAPR
jgi:hypothetical protein